MNVTKMDAFVRSKLSKAGASSTLIENILWFNSARFTRKIIGLLEEVNADLEKCRVIGKAVNIDDEIIDEEIERAKKREEKKLRRLVRIAVYKKQQKEKKNS